MKKLLFSLLFTCLTLFSYSQIPVTDAAANANMTINQAINAVTWGNQLTELLNQSKVLTTTLEYVQKVSSAVRDAAYAKDLMERQKYIVSACSRVINNHKGLSADKIKSLSQNLSSLLSANNSLISLVNSTLTSKFKMDDAGRMQLMKNVKEEQQNIINSLGQVDLIISTSQVTKDIIDYRLFK